ncbi:MAG: hypothetical protein WA988_12295 [Candidatus Nanopelagicales bacterium]
MPSRSELHATIGNANIPLQRRNGNDEGDFFAEMWCEFDCVAYVFTGSSREEVSGRLQAARGGEQTWDYVRPLSKDELYAGLV